MVVNAENPCFLAGHHFSPSDSAVLVASNNAYPYRKLSLLHSKWQLEAMVPIAGTRLQITNVQLSTSYRDGREI